ncbi:MFS transporter [Desulfobulbus rhabdoformis]|uniref:MFS transporter n=1 Tax=Desulfobulbus rhabdoformis TaxID=34032 RepID=UPI001964EB8A|nr:MFS transporter [Desulfobulbus rhabdoformis]MBM9613760.1 MFS transporter [Desulfobulbus rhabdoformis]
MPQTLPSAGRLLLTTCIIAFFCFLGSFMRIPVVPLFAVSLGADTVQVGWINSAFMCMAGLLSIPSGLLSDKIGRRRPLLVGLILLASSSLLLTISQTPLQMGVIYLFFGVGMAAVTPTLMSYVADITPPEALGNAFGWYTMALYCGMTLGPAAGGFLGGLIGFRAVFVCSGCMIAMMMVVTFFRLPDPPRHLRRAAPTSDFLTTLRQLAKNRRLLACLLVTVGACMGFGMFITFVPLYVRSLGLPTVAVGIVCAVQALANAVARIPAGWLCDRIRDRRLLVSGGLFFFALANASFSLCHSLVTLLCASSAMGLSMGVAFTVICALIADSVPGHIRGLAMGCYNTCVYAGMLCCAIGMGMVIHNYGFHRGFVVTGAIIIVALFFFTVIYGSPQKIPRYNEI